MRPINRLMVVMWIVIIGQTCVSASRRKPTSIDNHSEVVALQRTVYFPTSLTACTGTILNHKSVLSAARCFQGDSPQRWTIRVGSSRWKKGGTVYPVSEILPHPDWDEWSMRADIAIVHTTKNIVFGRTVQHGQFAGHNYIVPEHEALFVVGWGYTGMPGWTPSTYEKMNLVQLSNLDLRVCQPPYSLQGFSVTTSQLCIGFTNPKKQLTANDKCFGEPGAPIFHEGVVVAIRSYALSCDSPDVPSINTRVGSFVDWIVENS